MHNGPLMFFALSLLSSLSKLDSDKTDTPVATGNTTIFVVPKLVHALHLLVSSHLDLFCCGFVCLLCANTFFLLVKASLLPADQ